MKTKTKPKLSEFDRGFERCTLLFLSRRLQWTRKERRTFGKIARMLFGKKRK